MVDDVDDQLMCDVWSYFEPARHGGRSPQVQLCQLTLRERCFVPKMGKLSRKRCTPTGRLSRIWGGWWMGETIWFHPAILFLFSTCWLRPPHLNLQSHTKKSSRQCRTFIQALENWWKIKMQNSSLCCHVWCCWLVYLSQVMVLFLAVFGWKEMKHGNV